jgi:hypothetical protein
MNYNIKVSNRGPLPIPYITRVGDQVVAGSLFKDKEIHCDALFIGATPQHQLLVHCTKCDYIFEPSSELEINLCATTTQKQPSSAS